MNQPLHESSTWLSTQRTLIDGMWIEPLHNVGSCGEDVFEWWHGTRKLTVDLEYGVASFTKVWGPDPDTEMEDGEVNDFLVLWSWLMEGK